MELATKSEKGFTSEMRLLNDAEIDHVGGGYGAAVVVVVAVAVYLAKKYIEQNYQ